MSLKQVHILLISLSAVLMLLFGGVSLRGWSAGGGPSQLGLGLFSLACSAGLLAYVWWFARSVRTRQEEDRRRRKLIEPLVVGLVGWQLGARPALACAVCYGQASGPMIDAARLGVWLLFGLVFAVQLALAAFFIHLWRKARGQSPIEP